MNFWGDTSPYRTPPTLRPEGKVAAAGGAGGGDEDGKARPGQGVEKGLLF